MRSLIRPCLAATVTLVACGRLAAHPLSVSYSRFAVQDRRVEATIRLPLDDIDLLLRLDGDLDGVVSLEELRRAQEAIAGYVRDQIDLTADGVTATPSLTDTSIWKDSQDFPYVEASVTYEAGGPIRAVEIQVRVLTHLYTDHRNLSEVEFDGRREELTFQYGNTYTVARGQPWRTAAELARAGLEHIFTGPDHIVFLCALLLPLGRGLRSLVAIVPCFVLAHGLTLTLATLGVLLPMGSLIEPAIALSIAYVGLENLLVTDLRHRWRIALAFGLVHGFGFASILGEMDLQRVGRTVSLLMFNLGIDIAEVMIVGLMWPFLRLLESTPHRALVTRLASSVVVALGLFWFVERVS